MDGRLETVARLTPAEKAYIGGVSVSTGNIYGNIYQISIVCIIPYCHPCRIYISFGTKILSVVSVSNSCSILKFISSMG